MVHQHFKLVPSLTVAENVFLGAELVTRTRSLDRDLMVKGLAEVSERYGLKVDPRQPVERPLGRPAATGRDPQGAVLRRQRA